MECGRTIGGGGEKGSPTGPADSGPAVGADVTGGGSSGAEEAEKESVAPGPAGVRSSGGADMSGEWSPVGVSSWVGTAAQGTESIMARSEIGGRATALVVSTVEPMSVEEPSGLRKNALSGKTRPRPRAEPLAAECWAGAAACVWCLMDWRLGACRLGTCCLTSCRGSCRTGGACRLGACRTGAAVGRVDTARIPAMRSCQPCPCGSAAAERMNMSAPRPTVTHSRSAWMNRRVFGASPVAASTRRTPMSRPPGLQPVRARSSSRGTATAAAAPSHAMAALGIIRPRRSPSPATSATPPMRSIAPAMTRLRTAAGGAAAWLYGGIEVTSASS